MGYPIGKNNPRNLISDMTLASTWRSWEMLSFKSPDLRFKYQWGSMIFTVYDEYTVSRLLITGIYFNTRKIQEFIFQWLFSSGGVYLKLNTLISVHHHRGSYQIGWKFTYIYNFILGPGPAHLHLAKFSNITNNYHVDSMKIILWHQCFLSIGFFTDQEIAIP